MFRAELDHGREAGMHDPLRATTGGSAPSSSRAPTTRCRRGACGRPSGSTARRAANSRPGRRARRDCAGATLGSFITRSALRHGLLYADPHPGNHRLLDDGRVAFLDSGCVKELPPARGAGVERYIVPGLEARWGDFDRALVEARGCRRDDEAGRALSRACSAHLLAPFASSAPFRGTRDVARGAAPLLSRRQRERVFGQGGAPRPPRPIDLPKGFTFVNRLRRGPPGVLAGLDATVRFRALADPWLRVPLTPPRP